MSLPRTTAVLAILTVLLGVWLGITTGASQGQEVPQIEQPVGPSEPIELLRSDADGITIAVDVSGAQVVQETISGIEYDTVSIPGFGSSADAGSPQVPSRRLLLGIPLGADYSLSVSVDESEMVPGSYRLPPAPTPNFEPDLQAVPDAQPVVLGTASWRYAEDASIYSTNALYPQAIARVTDTGFLRDQRFIAVEINPAQYNPISGELILHRQFTIELKFTYQRGAELGTSRSDASFEQVLSASLLNYESAAKWRGKPPATIPAAALAADAGGVGSPALKIMVDQDGIYQVSAADLEALDVPVSATQTTSYKLFFRGREVPIRVFETPDKTLDYFWFYGEQARSKYTETNVYWLTYAAEPGGEPGLRMQLRSVLTESAPISAYYSDTVRLEEDHIYRPDMPSTGHLDSDPWDHWFWTYTRNPYSPVYDPDHPPEATFSTQISHVSTEKYLARLRASLSGLTSSWTLTPDHCVDFLVNGEKVGDHTWDGAFREQLVSFAFTSTLLVEGLNTVEVQACETPTVSDVTYYDWFEIDLRRDYQADDDWLDFEVTEPGWEYLLEGFAAPEVELFDVSGTYTVSQLIEAYVDGTDSPYSLRFYDAAAVQGTRYLALSQDQLKSPLAIVESAPTALKDTLNQADYIIIAPREFITDVQPLADYRAGPELTVKVVELEHIFDEFNYGIYSPEAIRDFLAYAYGSWQAPAPAYVLLVGDGTYDFKSNLGLGSANLVPPYLAPVDPWLGETAADNRYVSVSGEDIFPDMYIGRFPAQTTAHVRAMVQKTIAYETNPALGDWTERILFVADNPDDAGNFHALSDNMVSNYLPEPYLPIKAYLASTCMDIPACNQVILDTLNNTGALLVNYIGHGGIGEWNGWALQGTDRVYLWATSSLSDLEPTARLPVMLPMTCLEGAFHWAERNSLAEATVRLAGRGAVASWSPTGEGVAEGHEFLNQGFFRAVLYNGVRQLGPAALVGKAEVLEDGHYTDLIETYHLFGDPALRLNSLDVVDVAVGQTIVASTHDNTIEVTLNFTNTGPDVAAGVVLTDLLPSELLTPTVVYASPEVLEQREGIIFAWTIADLMPGASGQIVIGSDVDPETPLDEVSFFNVARIGVETHDLVPTNNVSRAGFNLSLLHLPLVLRGY